MRTQSFAYPLCAVVLLLLSFDSRRPSRRVYLVLPLLLLWGNLHGSAVLGAAMVSLRGIVAAWESRTPHGGASQRRRAAVLTLLPPILLLITPYGRDIAFYYRDTLLTPAFSQLSSEWRPVTSDLLLAVPLFLLAALALVAFVRNPRATTAWEKLAMALLLIAGATAVRNVVWAALAAVPLVGLAIAPSVPRGPVATSAPRLNRVLVLVAVAALAATTIATIARPARAFDAGYPRGLLQAVSRGTAADPSAIVVADLQYSDWLLWHEPRLRGRVAFDARLELLSADGLHEAGELMSRAAGGHGLRLFVLDRQSDDVAHSVVARLVAALLADPAHRTFYDDGRRAVILAHAVQLARAAPHSSARSAS